MLLTEKNAIFLVSTVMPYRIKYPKNSKKLIFGGDGVWVQG